MAADLHIHILKGVTEVDLANFFSHSLGSKWFNLDTPYDPETFELISMTPSIWIGEVSWLKADLFEDSETFIPDTIQTIQDLITEDLPVLDETLLEKILQSFSEPNTTGYSVIDILPALKGGDSR